MLLGIAPEALYSIMTCFLIQNEKNEWVIPKGLIKEGESPEDAAIEECLRKPLLMEE